MPQPTSSIAAPSDGSEIDAASLLATGQHAANLGLYGLVWIDTDLVARSRFGPLVDFIATGHPITDSVLPLIGLEDDIEALKVTPHRVLELPAVAVVSASGAAPRLNFTVFWVTSAERFLLLVYRASSRSDIEVELTRQVRGRLIAEAEVQAKSRELTRANAELELANRDLEQYASIISHDLKAPLRALRYLTDEAGAAVAKAANDDATRLLGEIRDQARRMSRMMSGLLDYASAGRKSDMLATVDTAALINAIATSLPKPPGVRIDIAGAWPTIETLEAPLDLVLRNLIDNAIKHHDRPDGVICVEANDMGGHLLFTITDDGPGIPASAHETVFLPFRTLGGPTGGTGMGLALVRRTLETLDGRIEIVATDPGNRGTTFRVIWPKTPPG